jgi:hypothetical protein
MSTTICPHCQAETITDAAFCSACGQALPASSPSGPRVVESSSYATTSVGQGLQSEELHKQSQKAAGALLIVAFLQAVFSTLILVGGVNETYQDQTLELNPVVFIVVYGIAAVFFGLFLWARKSPLPAAIVGLAFFVTVHLVDALADPAALLRGILVKVIIIVILVRAIKAGIQHRELLRQSQQV